MRRRSPFNGRPRRAERGARGRRSRDARLPSQGLLLQILHAARRHGNDAGHAFLGITRLDQRIDDFRSLEANRDSARAATQALVLFSRQSHLERRHAFRRFGSRRRCRRAWRFHRSNCCGWDSYDRNVRAKAQRNSSRERPSSCTTCYRHVASLSLVRYASLRHAYQIISYAERALRRCSDAAAGPRLGVLPSRQRISAWSRSGGRC